MSLSEKIRLLIVDDHVIVREGLKQIIHRTPDIAVTAEAADGQELFSVLRKSKIDVVLLDLSMPGRSGLDILLELHRKYPRLPVLVLSHHPEDQMAMRALKAGAAGYLTKGSSSTELLTAIRKVVRGGKYVTSALAERLADEFQNGAKDKPLHQTLSQREYEVMGMIASGKSLSHIAETLSLSVKTISTYRTRILEKLSIDNNANLVRYAIEQGLAPQKK